MSLADVRDADCLIFAVGHKEFKNLDIHEINGMYRDMDNDKKILIDVRAYFQGRNGKVWVLLLELITQEGR